METLYWILFESLPVLGGILFVVIFILLVRWRQGGRALPLLLGLGIAAILLLVELAVVTHREHAAGIMNKIEDALLAKNPKGVIAVLDGNFSADRMDAQGFEDLVREQTNRIDIHRLWRMNLRIARSDATSFVARMEYFSQLTVRDQEFGLTSSWEITFVARDGGYRISDIQPLKIGQYDMNEWQDVRELR